MRFNRNISKRVFIVILGMVIRLCFGSFSNSQAQNIKDDLSKIIYSYKKAQNLNLEVDVRMFHLKTDKTPVMEKKASIKKQGERFFYILDQIEMAINCLLYTSPSPRDA